MALEDIDGYVSKDSLYRLLSKLRLQDPIITEEQAHVICDKIVELPDELPVRDQDILASLEELKQWRENPFLMLKKHCEIKKKCDDCEYNDYCSAHTIVTTPEEWKL